MASIDLGMVTAYAYAVAGGYTGSEQDFEDLLGNIASDLEEIENLSVTVTTLPEGSQATASYNNGVLSLGIPKGDTGATGAEGPEGPTGPTGNGIQSIAKTGTSGNVDTYTITYTNGQTTTFTVTNGSVTSVDGQTGDVDLSNKANIDGYYEDLTAGYAENLISNVYDEENVPYNFRTAGGSLDIGSFEYDEVVGGTVAVNQLLNPQTSGGTNNGITYTVADGKYVFNDTASATASINFDKTTIAFQANHVYYFAGISGGSSPTYQMVVTGYNQYMNEASIKKFTTAKTEHFRLSIQSGVTVTNLTAYPQVVDLTQMFGTTIADYIYTLETGNAGAGVAWFKKLFPKSYYPYNTGELMHVQTSGHKMVGFNQWDGTKNDGKYWSDAGVLTTLAGNSCTDKVRVVSDATYYFYNASATIVVKWFTEDMTLISKQNINSGASMRLSTSPSNAYYVTVNYGGGTFPTNFCINLHWDGERDGEYEAYTEHTYPLDSDLVLRGIPKLDSANKLHYDGDTYASDGTVTRKYGIVDMGTLSWTAYGATSDYGRFISSGLDALAKSTANAVMANFQLKGSAEAIAPNMFWISSGNGKLSVTTNPNAYADATAFKTAMNGVYLVYELATPTTETADTFQSPQSVSNWGTEEYIDTRSIPIPVGHNTKYPPDLKAKLETSPNPPDADGDYIVRQTNGVNEYVALSTNATIQNIISRLEALEG